MRHLCSTTRPPDPAPLLEAALLASAQMLIARHPDLLLPHDVPRLRPPQTLRAAQAVMGLLEALLGALADYNATRDAALPSSAMNDDIPF